MIQKNEIKIRHLAQAEMLNQTIFGEEQAIKSVVLYLSSSNPSLRQIMKETICDYREFEIWQRLLEMFAWRRWGDVSDFNRLKDQRASARLDVTIIDLFRVDKSSRDKDDKEKLLGDSLKHSNPKLRYAAGYILGMRGDMMAVPALAETIEFGDQEWQFRAVEALAAIKHECVGAPLMKALTSSNRELHRRASKALNDLGNIVEEAWIAVLDHLNDHIRWHAARGLGNLGNPRYADLIAEGLCDQNDAVRWASADVLAGLGASSIPATLKVLSQKKLTEPVRRATYHALHGIAQGKTRERIKPLLDALQGSLASIEAPSIAQRLLFDLEKEIE